VSQAVDAQGHRPSEFARVEIDGPLDDSAGR
jgi:hypothetical protein